MGAGSAGSAGRVEAGSGGTGTAGSGSGGSAGQAAGVGGQAQGEAGIGDEGGASPGGGNGGSGGGPSASCDDVTPCGGDVVGTWTVIDSCLAVGGSVELKDFGLGCNSAPTTGSLEVTGTWSASAEGLTISDNTTTSGDATFDVPQACADTGTTPIACPRLAEPIGPHLSYASLACVDSTSAWCECSGTVEQTGGMGLISTSPITSGTFATADGVLTVSDGTNHTEYAYCSSGDTLTLSLKSVGKTGTVTGTVLLQRR